MSELDEDNEDKTDENLDDEESAELGEDEEIEDLDDDEDLGELDDDTRDELKVADEVLSQKELNARALAIRRAIEKRAEDKQLDEDLNFLDLED